MLSHEAVWGALDTLAHQHQLTPSGLARRAGLDPTSFNKSKRSSADGRPRWPSTESLSKVMDCLSISFSQFATMCEGTEQNEIVSASSFPSYFCTSDDLIEVQKEYLLEFKLSSFCDTFIFPSSDSDKFFALEVSGNSFEPYYRSGQIVIVSPDSSYRRRDPVLVRTQDGVLHCGLLQRHTNEHLELMRIEASGPPRVFASSDVTWTARVLWVSQ